jgi:hypothetical protein
VRRAPGIVDQDVDAPEMRHRGTHHAPAVFLDADVNRHAERLRPRRPALAGDGIEQRRAARGQHQRHL